MVGILLIFNRILDAAVPPVGGPQKDIDRRFRSIVEHIDDDF